MTEISLAQYTGPYDALLRLIEAKELSITEVSLSEVTEQFLSYLDTLEEEQPEEVADFLTVAARLLLMKSSLLLPTFQVVEQEDDVSLTDRLKLYERFQHASQYLAACWESPVTLGTHQETFVPKETFSWPESLSVEQLRDSMKRVIDRNKPPKPLPKTKIDKTVSLKETISRLRNVLKKGSSSSFWQHADRASKTSVIIHFLALLELTKLGAVQPSQSEHFSDITLKVSS